jgi:hypothetical protein
VAKPKRVKKPKPKRATSHADFAGAEPDTSELGRLVAEAEKANAKAAKPVPLKLLKHHIQQIQQAEAVSDQAKAHAASKRKILANRYKTAAMDGIDPADMKRAFKLAKLPQGVVVVSERNVRAYLIAMDVAIGHQWSLFDSPKVDVKAMGEHAGKNGEPPDNNPHKPGTEEHVLWTEGHQMGQASIAEEMRPN